MAGWADSLTDGPKNRVLEWNGPIEFNPKALKMSAQNCSNPPISGCCRLR